MTALVSLADAIAELVHDGDAVALEGFTHLIPFAGHEVLRQGRRDLELVRMTPDVLYDQMIGMGAGRRLVFSYGGNPGVGSLHRFRDAVENGWPQPLEIDEHSHAGMANPALVLVYESGTIGAKAHRVPLSIGDGDLAETADAVVGVVEMFNYWIAPGRIDVAFLGAAQVDRFANLNSTAIGAYSHPRTRLPGAGGAPEIAASCGEVVVIAPHSRRTFVATLDFVTTVGHGDGPGARERLGFRGAGPTAVITDLGVLEPDHATRELTLTRVHPGVGEERVRAQTGWPLAVADAVDTTPPPTDEELAALRELVAR